MDIRTIKTFVLAAEHENFRIVADMLYVTQPAISTKIRLLEEELGDKLFIKEGRNVILTEFGRLFYNESKNIIAQYNQSMDKLNQFRQGYHKSLRLAISPILADTVLPAIINKYIKDHPFVELTIHVMESTEISSKIENGEVDIGLSCIPGASTVKSIQFHEEDVPLVMLHDGYDSESAPYLDSMEILQNNIIFTDNHPEYWNNLTPFLRANVSQLKMMKINQSYITKRFVLEGIGVSFLPRSTIKRELLEGRLIEVPVEMIQPPIARMYLIFKNNYNVDKEFKEFISNFHYS